ncbi:MAG: hypothetical protein JW838_04355 [Spirochaetes bacterium]|nr:hypothetical protein [Spirochaetota bacterium]
MTFSRGHSIVITKTSAYSDYNKDDDDDDDMEIESIEIFRAMAHGIGRQASSRSIIYRPVTAVRPGFPYHALIRERI